MSSDDTIHRDTTSRLDRRAALRTGGVLAGTAALLGVSSHTAAAQQSTNELVLDITVDGRTSRMNRLSQIGPPLMGDTFIVTGSIFPGGAFDDGVTSPDDDGAIGKFLCQGTFLVDVATGALPHVFTTQQFILGDNLSSSEGQIEAAPDALISVGVEGGVAETWRSVSGGSGAHAGASGSVHQLLHGTNETFLQVGPNLQEPAPNYQFIFSLAG